MTQAPLLSAPLPPGVLLEVASPGLDQGVEIAVVVPTFRRPALVLRTLASLRAQEGSSPFAVILVENDAEGRAGLDAARPLFESGALPGAIVMAQARGNCAAYNAGFAVAARLFPQLRIALIVDDDEAAEPGWIAAHGAALDRLGVDITGGPQIPVFEDESKRALAAHPVFRAPFEASGPIGVLVSSGNVAIRADVLRRMGEPLFDTRFDFTGGGDADLFSRCREAGFRFGWCREAAVHEIVPARRTQFSWINARALRNGALSTLVQRGRDGRARTLAKSLALALAAPPRSVIAALRSRSALIGLYHLQIAIGRLQGEFGRVGEQYRKPESN
ncbi:glycosyltransferase family 2 protein [Aureimonas sp. AU40]|uniref:glycosyltransferase family 2 protein n=1 Tax=Aureimonas sp. AU40 TaxID=1637747 RepID=UPI0007847576|nr:glycosyltransferase [Aureimonas sp. AU40]